MNKPVAITLNINGRNYPIAVETRLTLADAVRDRCGLTGTHVGCEHGVCGTCTVIVDGQAVRSCLMFAVQADEKPIRTVESLEKEGVLHPLQRAFIANHALQCGFCTSGFLILAAHTLEVNPYVSETDLVDILSSNLCRCTGYRNIRRAVLMAQKEMLGRAVITDSDNEP